MISSRREPATSADHRHALHRSVLRLLALLIALAFPATAPNTHAANGVQDSISVAALKMLTLEELMSMPVAILSKRAEPVFDAPAAVQVVNSQFILRSPATNLPEALRFGTNFETARINARQWAITTRGFNGTSTSNKLLVMIDGRSIYSPLFAGVFWETQDVLLEDIDRIEAISGPGGTLWGANATNGVINVVTKSATDPTTQGVVVKTATGSEIPFLGAIRYGARANERLAYRAYLKHNSSRGSRRSDGSAADDSWNFTHGGFRTDWEPSDGDRVTVQGNVYDGSFDLPTSSENLTGAGGNLLARWDHPLPNFSNVRVQAYYDLSHRHQPGTFRENLHTLDTDFQHRLHIGAVHDLVWGAGYRRMADYVGNTAVLAFLPPTLTLNLYTAFVQDEILLIPDRVRLTIGSKFEHNDFTGFEIQPSARVAYKIDAQQTLWGAVSRSVRTPSRIDRQLYVPGDPPFTTLNGGPNFQSEKLVAFELGYRRQLYNNGAVGLTSFYNLYDDLRALEPATAPFVITNGLQGQSYGGHVSVFVQVLDWWRTQLRYRYLHQHFEIKPTSSAASIGTEYNNDPKNQVSLSSLFDVNDHLELGAYGRYVGRLPNSGVPAYATFDLAVHWHPQQNLTFSIFGLDLPSRSHAEFGPATNRFEIPRSVYIKVRWQQQ
jgi:iron complex outermembrane receptor protein